MAFVLATLASEGQAQARQASSRLSEQLTDIAEKLFDLNVRVPALFVQTFREEGAGEGLASRLFSDPISVLELALEKNEQNIRARFLLAKCYLAKSSQGEGRWSKALFSKAEHEFNLVLAHSGKPGLSPKQLREARKASDDIRKIRQGQGELVD